MIATASVRFSNYLSLLGELISAQLSVWTFGNQVGIANNLTGRRLIREARKATRDEPWPYADNNARLLEQEGYVRLSDIYEPGLVKSLSGRSEKLLVDPEHSRPAQQALERGNPDASRYLVDPLGSLPDLQRLINDRVAELLKSRFGGHFRWTRTAVYRTSHIPDASKELYSNIWHADRINTSYLQLFVYLSPNVTSESTGAFQIHSRRSSTQISRRGFLHRRIILGPAKDLVDDPRRIISMEGDAGTAFVAANAYCLHRAGVPSVGQHRDVAVFSFIPATEPFDGRQRPHPLG